MSLNGKAASTHVPPTLERHPLAVAGAAVVVGFMTGRITRRVRRFMTRSAR
jgi:hypothetical protein